MAQTRSTGMPQEQFRLPLKLKLSLLITALLILTVALVTAFLLHQQQQSLTLEMTKRGLTIATHLAISAKNPILTNDELTLNLLVKGTGRDPDVVYAVIVNEGGKILAHQDVSLIGTALERPAGLRPVAETLLIQSYTDARHGRLTDFAVPLAFSRVPVGTLYLGFSHRSIENALTEVRKQTILASAVMVLVGVIGAINLAAVLSRPVLRLVEATRAIAAGNFQISLAIPSRDEIGALTAAFNQMAESLREKEIIRHAFSRYVPREVADEILKDPGRLVLTGERRDVTVLFCDVRGFTRMSERLTPEAIVSLLNEFYTLMIDATFREDGTLDKFLGDGVMAIFGAPIPHEDHSIRAIRAALAMQAGMAELSRRRIREGGEPIAVGIGVSAGEVVAGTVGAEDRMEYTVIGDSVNLAARLESTARAGQILISQRTYENVKGLVKVRSLGVARVKGREEQVEVFQVLGLIPAGAELER